MGRVRRTLHRMVDYDALHRRKRGVWLFFLIGVIALFGLTYAGFQTDTATELWVFILVRLLIGLLIACLVLPVVWFLRRKLRLPKTPAAIVYLAFTIGLTIFVIAWL